MGGIFPKKRNFRFFVFVVVCSLFFLLGSVYTVNAQIALNTSEIQQGVNVRTFGAVGNGVNDDTEALVRASQRKGTLYFPTGNYLLNRNLHFNEQTILVFGENACIQVGSGVTLRINGSFTAGLYQIFGGAGLVIGQPKNMQEVYPEWFGALGNDEEDDRPAIQAAIRFAGQLNQGGSVIFGDGNHYILKTMTSVNRHFLLINGNVSFSGKGTVKVGNHVGPYKSIFEYTSRPSNISLANFTIDSNSAHNPRTSPPELHADTRIEIQMDRGSGVRFDSLTIKNSLAVHSLMMHSMRNVTVVNCSFLQMGSNSNQFLDTSTLYIVGDHATIANNQFVATGSGTNTAILVQGAMKTVQDNVIENYRIGILYATASFPQYQNRDCLLVRNRMNNTIFGISLVANSGDISNLTIRDNDIQVHAAGGGNYSPHTGASSGIKFQQQSSYKWTNITIQGNTIQFSDPGNGFLASSRHCSGIDLALYGNGTNVEGLLISDNIIRNSYTNGISWGIIGLQSNVVVENNIIINPGSSYQGIHGFSSGIELYDNHSFHSCYVRNNSIVDDRVPTKMYTGLFLRSKGETDQAATQLYWRNNSITAIFPFLSSSPTVVRGNTPVTENVPLSLPTSANQQEVNVRTFGAMGDGINDDTEALIKGSQIEGTLYFPTGTYVLNRHLHFSEKTKLKFGNNARIQTGSGVILRIDSSLTAGLHQIFGGTGLVIGQPKDMKEVYPEWFGACGNDEADDRPAIQAAIQFASQLNQERNVVFGDGNHYILQTMTLANRHFLLINGNVSFSGKGTVKVGNDVGSYKSIFQYTSCPSNISLTNFTIDSNSAYNLRTTQPEYSVDARIEIEMDGGSGVRFDSLTIKNSLAVQSLMMNSMKNVTVINCSFLQMGANSNMLFDTSTLYIVGDRAMIANNQFVAAGPGAHTAIEVHGAMKTVQNNIIKKYRIGILYGTASSPRHENRDCLLAHNRMENTVYGISLWAVYRDISNLTIRDNDIQVHATGGGNYAPHPQASGIRFHQPSSYKWKNISIKGNNIQFSDPGNGFVTSNQHAAGIDLALYGGGTNVEGLLIANNSIHNAYTNGISWSIIGPQSNVIVENNVITNPGSLYNGIHGYSSGIALYDNSSFNSCYIRNNSISDNRTPSKMYTGLLLYSKGKVDQAATQLYWQNNSVTSVSPLLSGRITVAEGNTPMQGNVPVQE